MTKSKKTGRRAKFYRGKNKGRISRPRYWLAAYWCQRW
jgi:hypothetical protein